MAYQTIELAAKITGDASSFIKESGKVTDSSKKGSDALQNFASGAKKAAVVMGVAGAGLTLYAKSATDYTVDLYKSSKQLARNTGTTIENASQLVHAADKMGISAEQATATFGIFSKKIVAASDDLKNASQAHAELQNKIDKTKLEIQQTTDEIKKNGDKTGELALKVRTLNTDLAGQQQQLAESSNSFEKLGIKVTDASGNIKPFNDLLLQVADKFKGMKDGSEKTALAMDLFGKSGKNLLPLLNQGSQGIQNLENEANKLGLTLTATTVTSIKAYIQSQKELKDSTDALKISVGTLTAPVLTSFNEKINSTLQALLASHGVVRDATLGFLAFGGPILSGTAALVAFSANLVQIWPQLTATAVRIYSVGAAAVTTTGRIAAMQATSALGLSIGVAGALVDLALVLKAVQAVRGAINELNAAAKSKAGASSAMQQRIDTDRQLVKSGTAAQKARAAADLQSLGPLSLASGGFTGQGPANEVAGIVHRGEYVLPKNQVDQSSGLPKAAGGGSTVNLTVNVGMYAGMPVEKRQIALELYKELVRAARSQGVSLPMIGAIGVQ